MEKLLNSISHDEYLSQVDDYLPSAWLGHAPFLKFLIREFKPRNYVELGVHNGFSYFVGCQAISECKLDTKAFGIDHWIGDLQAGFFDERVFDKVSNLNRKYASFSKLLRMTFSDALHEFDQGSIDLLHIDGFHSYESVKEDFETWLRKMNPNGLILLHDIHVRRNTFGVFQFWKEIKEKYKTIEFVGSHGLGLVFLGEIPSGKLSELVKISEDGEISQVQGTFGSISDDVIQNSRNYEYAVAIAERDNAIAERDNAIAERDNAIAERDNAIAERDNAIAERDNAIAERVEILKSKVFTLTELFRRLSRMVFGAKN